MKTKKSLLVVPAIALVFTLVFTSCSNGGGGGGGRQDNSSGSVRFNLTGAKAIAAAQGRSGSGRAVNGSGNGLFKLLENDSFESIVSGNHEIPEIQFLARSPVEGKKDIYISFENEWRTDNGTVGSFIHVKEDGSVVNILEGWDSIDTSLLWAKDQFTSPLAFDQYGNMYFKVHVSDYTNSIYKYNPVTGKKEQLVPTDSNIRYGKIVVSSDGSYLIVDGSRQRSNNDVDALFARIIPTANPQNMVEHIVIQYDGEYEYREEARLVYAFRRNELYMSGTKIFGDENKNGFYKVTFEGLAQNEWQWEKLFDATESNYNFAEIYILFVAPDNSVWGNDRHLARIINSNGQSDLYKLTDLIVSPNDSFKSSASHLYFKANEADPYSTGYFLYEIYRASYSNPTSAQNVFSGITTRNTKNMMVMVFDIGGDYLYFNAVEKPYPEFNNGSEGLGGDYFNGKINLTTLEYTELEFSWNITALVAY